MRCRTGLSLLVILGLIAGACGGDDSTDNSQGRGGAETDDASADGGFDPNGVLRVGAGLSFVGGVTNFDPRISLTSNDIVYFGALYAPLMRYHPETGKYEPYLAESVDVVDPKTVRVTIRPDATFHNGDPVTAADAKATFEAMVANRAAGTANGLPADISILASVEVVDSKTFVLHLSSDGLGVVFELLAGRASFIVPAGSGASQNTAPVGTGPFEFVSYIPGQKLSVEKFPTFFDADEVKLTGIDFIDLDDGTPIANGLLGGDIDLTAGANTGGLDFPSYLSVSKDRELHTASVITGSNYIFFDMCKAPGSFYADPKVRQALVYGTDRDEIEQVAYGGLGEPATQMWPEDSPNFDPTIAETYAYDPEKAKELLAEAGIEEGTEIPVMYSEGIPESKPAAEAIQSQWGKIGLKVNLTTTDNPIGDFYTPAATGSPLPQNLAIVMIYTRGDAGKLSFLYTPDALRNTCNYLDQTVLDASNVLAGLRPDDPMAHAKWKEISNHIALDNAYIPLAFTPLLYGWSDRVGGMKTELLGLASLQSTQYDKLYIKQG